MLRWRDQWGTAAMARAFRYLSDSRDEATGERIELLDRKEGAWGCRSLFWCAKVCSKQIAVIKEIAQIKRRIYEAKRLKR